MIKFILKFCLLCTSYTGPLGSEIDADGWVDLTPVIKKTAVGMDPEPEDLGVWVYFSKQVGNENIFVSLPEDPQYRYISEDEMEITSSGKEGTYSLRILKPVSQESVETQVKEVFLQSEIFVKEVSQKKDNTWEIQYRKDGKWIFQTFVLNAEHLYVFQTEDPISHRENHEKFVSSLDVASSKK
jgi:hypothetical protein